MILAKSLRCFQDPRFLLSSLCLGLTVLVTHLRKRMNSFTEVPGLPFVGVMFHFQKGSKYSECIEQWADTYGSEGVYEFSVNLKRRIVCCKWEYAKQVLSLRPYKMTRAAGYKRVRELVPAVFFNEGQDWKRMRNLVAPAFSSASMHNYYPLVRDITDQLFEKLQTVANDEPFDISNLMDCYTIDSLCKVCFGQDFGAIREGATEILDILDEIHVVAGKRMMALFEYWRIPLLKRFDTGPEVFGKMNSKMEQMIKQMGSLPESETAGTLLNKLLQLEGEQLTHRELIGTMVELFMAGSDTSSTTLAWAFYHLSELPGLQEELAQEVERISPGKPPQNLETLQSMLLVRGVWAETLRLRSVAPVLTLNSTKDTEIAGRRVPAGSQIIVPTRYIQSRMPGSEVLGKDIREFRPKRWLGPDDFVTFPLDWCAFGYGARFCLGRFLADVEGLLGIAEVVRHFHISKDAGFTVAERSHFAIWLRWPSRMTRSMRTALSWSRAWTA